MNPLLDVVGILILFFTLIIFLIFIIKLVIYFFNRKNFPRITLASTLIGVILFLGIFIYNEYFFTFDDINKNDKQEGPEISSPTGKYTANAYYEPYGGAAGGVNVWIEVTNNAENTTKILYYADAKNYFQMSWLDEESLSISNSDEWANSTPTVLLKVESEIYHENGLACQSVLMKNDYEECYRSEYK